MGMIKKLWCGLLAIILMATVVASAAEPVGIAIRKRNAIGRIGLTNIKPTVKTEAGGSMAVTFQAPSEGTYVLVYTTGPNKDKIATSINVAKPGPVTTKIKGASK
jgi:hypothetical protein